MAAPCRHGSRGFRSGFLPLTLPTPSPGRLIPRWLFLRALGLIYFSAFYSLLKQVRGLIGPDGLQPAGAYLQAVKEKSAARRLLGSADAILVRERLARPAVYVWAGHHRVGAVGAEHSGRARCCWSALSVSFRLSRSCRYSLPINPTACFSAQGS